MSNVLTNWAVRGGSASSVCRDRLGRTVENPVLYWRASARQHQPCRSSCRSRWITTARSRLAIARSLPGENRYSFPKPYGPMFRAFGFDRARTPRTAPKRVHAHQDIVADTRDPQAGTSAVADDVALEDLNGYKPDVSTATVVQTDSSAPLDVYIPQGRIRSNGSADGPQSHISVNVGQRRGFELVEPNATPKAVLQRPLEDLRQQPPASSVAEVGLKEVLMFCIPAMGALLADPLMSLVDTVCVGQVSTLDLAALGPNTAIFAFINQVRRPRLSTLKVLRSLLNGISIVNCSSVVDHSSLPL